MTSIPLVTELAEVTVQESSLSPLGEQLPFTCLGKEHEMRWDHYLFSSTKKILLFWVLSLLLLGGLGVFAWQTLSVPDGLHREYFLDGSVRAEVYYKDKKPHGTAMTYYKNGHVRRKALFTDGKRNGVVQDYYESGVLKSEVSYKDDHPDGSAKFYNERGSLVRQVIYKDGKLVDTK